MDGIDELELGDDEGMLGIDEDDDEDEDEGDGILGMDEEDEDEDADGIDGILLEDWLWLWLLDWQPIRLNPSPPTRAALLNACAKCCFFMLLFPVLRPDADIDRLKQLCCSYRCLW